MQNMDTKYDPKQVESRLYEMWESQKLFAPHASRTGKVFSIFMPPPNITGQLHLGHALDVTMQDIPVRFHRLMGDETLWVPGTDHAAIATEVRISDTLAKEGIDKKELGREKFLERAWAWKEEYGSTIERQIRRLGASCDWDRKRFTMDEGCNRAVKEVFIRLYNKGLIYRGNRIINWCPTCRSALSDAEVEFSEQKSHLWYIRYPAQDGGEGLVVATTRPETMLGDTGVAVNPNDERYTSLIGKNVILPLVNRAIPVVGDEYVEKEFGTGAVKMTPAHDPNDFEVAMRHNLEVMRILNDDGTLNDLCGKYAGMASLEAREAIIADLKALGLLVKIEDYAHNVGTCYRCHSTIEPLTSTQWFVKMEPLAKPALEAVLKGETQFIPERFTKIYNNWMENIRDWCISRQLWWGHRIPAYYCDACGETVVDYDTPEKCPACGHTHFHQDEDVLDTWFSSALWPFSTLGWPDETEDLKKFYPGELLVTGYDIIFFWVARMIFSGIENMGQVPFKKVLIHGLTRDALGRKMSKSLGNGLDPLEVIDQYGADALRFSLVIGVAPGSDMRVSEEKFEAARNFGNKVWNAARFAMMNLEGESDPKAEKSLADKWILSRFRSVAQEITAHLQEYDLGLAAQNIYDFIWSEFCDWYLEECKSSLYGDDPSLAAACRDTLRKVLEGVLILLHPFMPFLTEEIYQHLDGVTSSISVAQWPVFTDEDPYLKDCENMEGIMEIVRAVRNLRAQMNVVPSRRAMLYIRPIRVDAQTLLSAKMYFERLCGASGVEIVDKADSNNVVSAVTNAGEVYLHVADLIDVEKEKARLTKERANVENEIRRAEGKLNNPGFVNKAPAAVVEVERKKLEGHKEMLSSLVKRLSELDTL